MKVLILDDESYRHDTYAKRLAETATKIVHAYSTDQAAEALGEEAFDVVYLDYHLGYYGSSGYETAQLIASMPKELQPSRVVVHTQDWTGARKMANLLKDAGVGVTIDPFSTFLD